MYCPDCKIEVESGEYCPLCGRKLVRDSHSTGTVVDDSFSAIVIFPIPCRIIC